MGKGVVFILSGMLLVVCGLYSDCAKASTKVTRSGDGHPTSTVEAPKLD